ncbi:hypothetical protein G7076_10525 [Sphingomonas sp. HDW15A]|uniref:hypothetical protein n=1 Tax=Sphingomonas sp. HDW15A TaxID=2714942 RepID=UPI00140B4E76|nr:hypothetical protein [Sphingomonas sp. HDW15A]QIK96809.1 hypothetical protein G7076_10525 [Sphingomonas sp. HDW15A]
MALTIGFAATVASAFLWHGPGGAAERFVTRSDQDVRRMLDFFELPLVEGHMQRDPVARRIIYSGPADEFQRTELVRIGESLPGVGEARWSRPRSVLTYPLPLAGEALAMALAAFLLGLTAAYILSLVKGGDD